MKHEITQEGYNKLIAEKDFIDTVERPRISQTLKEAIALGDLSENAEYISAKEEQEAMEKRRVELDNLISSAIIIKSDELDATIVQTGSVVTIKDMINKETATYQIVGTTEADPLNGKISNVCPVGMNILGHKKGDVVHFQVPDGPAEYKIMKIQKSK